MPIRHSTTFPERDQFVQMHQAQSTYTEISQQTGWARETVRKHCRNFRRRGVAALPPQRPGPPARGPLSTFAPLVRYAALRVKREHPAWGPAVILDELRQRTSLHNQRLPSVSQLAVYYQQFGERLLQPRRHLQLPPPPPTAVPTSEVIVFQLDMQERLHLPQLGYFNVVNVRAPAWGLSVGCYPHPAGEKRWQHKVSLTQIREDCRQTFAQWGLPEVVQTDRDKVLVPSGEYPFPSVFTLWLVGLGVQHRLIQRVTQNGSVERSHRTFDKQMLSGVTCTTWTTFLSHVAAEQVRLNERLPSRAKACRGQIPVVAHPEARVPRRPYRCEQEPLLFDMRRVYAYLAQGRWVRQASTHGQFKFADWVWSAGRRYENQAVVITFTAETHEFVISTTAGAEIKRMPSDWLTEATIRGVSEDEVVKVQWGV
jgi:hypothetical protein